MNKQIEQFRKAHRQFVEATQELNAAQSKINRYVEIELKKRKTVPRLMELIDSLPVGYKGKRRIYEVIYGLENSSIEALKQPVTRIPNEWGDGSTRMQAP